MGTDRDRAGERENTALSGVGALEIDLGFDGEDRWVSARYRNPDSSFATDETGEIDREPPVVDPDVEGEVCALTAERWRGRPDCLVSGEGSTLSSPTTRGIEVMAFLVFRRRSMMRSFMASESDPRDVSDALPPRFSVLFCLIS